MSLRHPVAVRLQDIVCDDCSSESHWVTLTWKLLLRQTGYIFADLISQNPVGQCTWWWPAVELNVGRFLPWLDQHQHHSTTDTMRETGKESMRTEIERLSKRDDIRLQENGTSNVTRNGERRSKEWWRGIKRMLSKINWIEGRTQYGGKRNT